MQEITQSYRRPETPSPEIWDLRNAGWSHVGNENPTTRNELSGWRLQVIRVTSGLLRGSGGFEVVQGDAFIVLIPGLAEDGHSLLVRGDRLPIPPRPPQGNAEIVQRHPFAVAVA